MSTGLQVRDLVVRFGSTLAVDHVDVDLAKGEVLALLGPSGSGKSSLLRGIAGLEPLAAGSVAWDGIDVTREPVHRRGFGVMFQDGQLFPHRDVAGNVGYGIEHLPRAERAARIRELLELVGLAGFESRPVTSLSGGQAQRVALARSLAPRPRLLLLDEPLSALDRALRERLVALLRDTLKTTGKSWRSPPEDDWLRNAACTCASAFFMASSEACPVVSYRRAASTTFRARSGSLTTLETFRSQSPARRSWATTKDEHPIARSATASRGFVRIFRL